jgi:hypothetical protein
MRKLAGQISIPLDLETFSELGDHQKVPKGVLAELRESQPRQRFVQGSQ